MTGTHPASSIIRTTAGAGALHSASNRVEGGRLVTCATAAHATPKLTIITVVYNGEEHLAATIDSVLALKTEDVEYIVIDGGSTDGTLELLHRYENQLDYWISEKDAGIYDAMNKGIRLARGEFVYHLNIGDELLAIPGSLFGNLPPEITGLAACVRLGPSRLHKPSVGLALRFHNTLHHQGCFYRRKADLHYDTRYRVFADFDLNQRLFKSGQRFMLSDEIVAAHDRGGISHDARYFHEVFEVVSINQGPFWLAVSYLYFKLSGLRSRLQRA